MANLELKQDCSVFKNKTEAYQAGYFQAARDIMILHLSITNANAQNIEKLIRKLINLCDK